MPFGIDESRGYGLIDIWFSPKTAKRCKKCVYVVFDTITVGGVAAVGAVAFDSVKDGVCEYGARKIARGVCLALITPAAAASVGSGLIAYSGFTKASKIYKSGAFLWNGGLAIMRGVSQGVTLPLQGASLLLCGTTYTPLVHNETLLNSTNVTAIREGFEEGLSLVNMTAIKQAAKEATLEAAKQAMN